MGVATIYRQPGLFDTLPPQIQYAPVHPEPGPVTMQAVTSSRLLVVLILVLLAGCEQLPDRPDRPAVDPDAARAAALMEAGQYAEAEALYRAMAARTAVPRDRAAHLLNAAEAAKANQNWDGVRSALAQMSTLPQFPRQALLRDLLTAELRLQENLPTEALGALGTTIDRNAPARLQRRYYRNLAEAYRQVGNPLDAAAALRSLDTLLHDPQARLDNQSEILRTLALMSENALRELQPSPPGIMGGWMQLALLSKQYSADRERLALQFADWRTRFPLHPAMPELLAGYQQQLAGQLQIPTRVAVLLPQSGAFAAVSAAIHDGMLITWYQLPAADRPEIRLYDAADPVGIWPLYSQAVADGAELVIGPLQKDAVGQLMRAGELPVPVLALNQVTIETSPPENLFMYSLSPEDEAQQAADRAWTDGRRRPVIFTPQGQWGDRLAGAFQSRWLSLGGSVAAVGRYDPGSHDYSDTIRQALQIDRSAKRRRELEAWLGRKLEFEPRRRGDVDAVFLAARPVQAQGIRPQLQFFHAADLPLYATSHAWTGALTRGQLADMKGIMLPDIPWLVDAANEQKRLEAARHLPGSSGAYGRLYAMGMDAMRLVPHLNRLRGSKFEILEGVTGNLYMDDINQIHRQLIWVELDEVPQLLGYSPRLDLGSTDDATSTVIDSRVETATAVESGGDASTRPATR